MKPRTQTITMPSGKLFSTFVVLVVSPLVFTAFLHHALAQKPTDAQLKVTLYECLKSKFPGVTGKLDAGLAGRAMFDPDSGRNFGWDEDKQAWVDTKTLECICPKCPGQPTEKKVTEKKKEACDIEFGYDYMRAPDESAKNLNGFGGSLFCNVKPWIAIGGDFGALFGSTTDTVGTTKIDVSLHRQTYLFGPQFNFYPNDKVKIFVHPLFGGVHDSTTTIFGTTNTDSSASAFAMAFGGGVDVNLNNRFAIRPIQFDYVPTRFGGAWQSNYQISTGVVVRFGGKK